MREAGFARYPKLEPNSKSMMKTKLTLFVSVLAVALFGMGCSSLDRGLVGYYPFNGNAKDESGNRNHGDPMNGPELSIDRYGNPESAFKFDGDDDFVDFGDRPNFDFGQGDFALCLWVHGSASDGGNIYWLIGKYKQGNKPGYGLGIKSQGNSPYAHIWDSGEGGWTDVRGSKDLIDGQWHHVSVVYDRDANLVIYVDGKPAAITDATEESGSVDNNQSLTIGKQAHGPHWPFKGSIDDVRIYNRALSAKEVKALYDLEKPKGK